MTEVISSGITITIPTLGETNWDQVVKAVFQKLSGHDHTGSGNGIQIATAALANAGVTLAKLEANLQSMIATGWVELSETWTYASATTVTVSSDATTRFEIGDRVRYKQGAGYKYGSVFAITATVLSITGGNDYSVANTGITNIAVARVKAPVDWPGTFAFTPSPTGFSVAPSIATARFRLDGNNCTVSVFINADGTSNSTAMLISAPLVAATVSGMSWGTRCWRAVNNGASIDTAYVSIGSSASSISAGVSFAAPNWTAANQKCVSFDLEYPIA